MLRDLSPFEFIRFDLAAERLLGVVDRTDLIPVDLADERLDARAKMENRQVCGSFKIRGAWNNIAQLSPQERTQGVVTCSSGNHGRALAWAAQRAGVPATIVMPQDAYTNKIQACRDLGARVVLSRDRTSADAEAAAIAEQGPIFVHPYDREGTVEGAGTVALELAEDWPEVELVLVPVGGGGLVAGMSLCLRRLLGDDLVILGVEPEGAPSMHLGLAAGAPVALPEITTCIQGLCPTQSGALNIQICSRTLDGVLLVDDESVEAAQARWVQGGEIVELAGAATTAAGLAGKIPSELLAGRTAQDPLRVVVVVSGGNPSPEQLQQARDRR